MKVYTVSSTMTPASSDKLVKLLWRYEGLREDNSGEYRERGVKQNRIEELKTLDDNSVGYTQFFAVEEVEMLLEYLADSYPEFTNEVMVVQDVRAMPAPSADPADGSLLTWSPWQGENARPPIPFSFGVRSRSSCPW